MRNRTLFAVWGGLFVLCAGLGFIPNPGSFRWLLTGLSLVFFVPGGVLLYRAGKRRSREALRLIRNLSALSLGLTAVLLAANILSALAPDLVGTALYVVLGIVSAPMLCSQVYALSLFLWACLLFASIHLLKTR